MKFIMILIVILSETKNPLPGYFTSVQDDNKKKESSPLSKNTLSGEAVFKKARPVLGAVLFFCVPGGRAFSWVRDPAGRAGIGSFLGQESMTNSPPRLAA